MSDNAKWYVVHTYSGYENLVKSTIEKTVEIRRMQEYIVDVRVPTETVVEIKDEKPKEVERKIFPGYVLVKMVMNDESWHVVRHTRGVTGFVGPGAKPIPLTEDEVNALGMEKREIIVPYAVGDKVTVVYGPFENFVAAVEEIQTEKNIVRVTVSMFGGREMSVELELDQVEPLK